MKTCNETKKIIKTCNETKKVIKKCGGIVIVLIKTMMPLIWDPSLDYQREREKVYHVINNFKKRFKNLSFPSHLFSRSRREGREETLASFRFLNMKR